MAGSLTTMPALETWSAAEWRERQSAHEQRVGSSVAAHLDRRARGLKHPVADFLFEYYPFPPSKLKAWLPPLGVAIEIGFHDLQQLWPPDRVPALQWKDGLAWQASDSVPEKVRRQALWVKSLCRAIAGRPARFSCLGLHEWAMVYRQSAEEVRHRQYPLRLPAEEVAEFVESRSLCCTHFDAFRFFTPAARPMNATEPTLEDRLENEQGGCLHANMDLYKWAFKLWPWSGSDLVGRTFELAMAGRQIDMKASPYDLRDLGYEPIPIETAEGRAEYEACQRRFAEASARLRQEIGEMADRILAMVGESEAELPELVMRR